jgi:ABC-type antimicrobial peptide transport system permease subunit
MSSAMKIVKGRNLTATDNGTNNVIVSSTLELKPLDLKPGDTITLVGTDRVSHQTVTIVGFYQTTGFGSNLDPVLGTNTTTKGLSAPGVDESVFYLKINPNTLNSAVNFIGKTVPNAFVLNLANISDFIDQLLNDILLTLTTIASLSLLAGVIIIANAVALSMLERRRELGILKSVGYTSRTILSEVLLENGIVGGTGAFVSMLVVALVTSLLGTYAFKASFGVSVYITLGLIVGSALLAMLAAALVAWGAVRVRPLEVLRYE